MDNNKSALMKNSTEGGVKKATETVFNRAANALVDYVKNKYGEAQVKLGTAYQLYLENAMRRYNKVRTLATGLEPRKIIGEESIYIEIGVRYDEEEIETTTVKPLLDISKNILILGTGGVGKSMLMRYLFLNTALEGEYVPVLLELRRISNQPSDKISIEELIYNCMKDFDVELPKEQFEYSLRLGKYLFLFDGFDEVKEILSSEAAAAIQSFCSKYPKNPCIMTSRPLQEALFETFTPVESMPLSKEKAIYLASIIWKEDEKTKEFCNQLDKVLYDQHRDFAENPLLLSMMFLTFMRNGSIPNHLADFYQKAYEALYSAHDSNDKGFYRRDFKCKDLNESDFKLLFSHFCFHSYFREKYEFSENDILYYLEKSIQKFKFKNVSAKDYLLDLRNIVCMIVKDGEIYRFAHRSFQAYFAAKYTSSVLTDEQQNMLFLSLLSGTEYLWQKIDYYELLNQIEPERFAINALEKGLRIVQEKTDNSTEQDIAFLKLITDGVDFNMRRHRAIEYYIDEANPNQYYFNVVTLFNTYISKIYDDVELNINERDADRSTIIYYILNKNLKKEKSFNDGLEFKKVDMSDSFTNEERNELYAAIIRDLQIPEKRNAIYNWLSDLDNKRQSLKSTNFIDEL